MYSYIEAIKDDVRDYIDANIDLTEYGNRQKLEESLYDELWVEDSVTGNASGSYTFSARDAEENLCGNWDLLAEALREFGGGNPLEMGAEACDVTIRCYLLGECIAEVLEELYPED